MRILFLSRWFPFPADNGSKIRVFNLIRQLSRRHEVTLVSFSDRDRPDAGHRAMEQYCAAVHTVPYRSYDPYRFRSIVGLLSAKPRSVVDTYSHAMAEKVQRVAASVKPALVIASQIDMAPYGLLVPGAKRMLEEVELAVLPEAVSQASSSASRLRKQLTWWKHARYVYDILCRFDGCTVVSREEEQWVRRFAPPNLPVGVIPNGVDLSHLSGDFGSPQSGTLIYTGALTYSANLDAMHYFVGDIFPLVLEQQPATRLSITGTATGVPVDRLPLHPQVNLTGYLTDIRPAVAQSSLTVVPLRIGGGTRLKILESLALGTPVVTTGKGIEGLDITCNSGIVIADQPADFAQATVGILQNPSWRTELSLAGLQAVQQYDWALIGPTLGSFLEELVTNKPTTSTARSRLPDTP